MSFDGVVGNSLATGYRKDSCHGNPCGRILDYNQDSSVFLVASGNVSTSSSVSRVRVVLDYDYRRDLDTLGTLGTPALHTFTVYASFVLVTFNEMI